MSQGIDEDQIRTAHSEYMAGSSTIELANKYSIPRHRLYVYFNRLGLHMKPSGLGNAPRPDRRSLTDDEVVKLHAEYMAGKTSTYLADKAGLANLTIRRHFLRLGLPVRSNSEARKNMWRSVDATTRRNYVKAANAKARGRKPSFEEQCKRAITREKWPTAFSDQEKYLARSLKLSCLQHSFQKACGPFNIDFALEGKIAIEVFGGNWHGTGRHAARFKRRSDYLLKDGWHIIIIWLVKQRFEHWPKVLRNMYALVDELKRSETPSIRTILANGEHDHTGAIRME